MEGTLDDAAVASSRGLGAKVRRIAVAMVVFFAVSIATEMTWWYVTGDGDSIVQQGIEFRARRAIADLGGSFTQVGGRTVRISFEGSEANDQDLRWVRHLPDLEGVELTGCSRMTDAGLAHLEGVAALNYLSIRGTGIRGEGLARLAHLPIRNVVLDAEQLDDAMFAGADALLWNYRIFLDGVGMRVEGTTQGTAAGRSPTQLQLRETRITDGALEIIGRRGLRVTRLDLFATRVTDAGLVHLHALSDLQWVDLMDTNVTLAGVLDLQAARPGLRIHVRNGSIQWNDERLRLTGAFIDDKGLTHLARMEALPPKLILDRCGVTDEAIAELRDAA